MRASCALSAHCGRQSRKVCRTSGFFLVPDHRVNWGSWTWLASAIFAIRSAKRGSLCNSERHADGRVRITVCALRSGAGDGEFSGLFWDHRLTVIVDCAGA